MQTFKGIGKVLAVLLMVSVLLTWFSHGSMNAYWQQTYHRASPLVALDNYVWWRSGENLQKFLDNKLKTVASLLFVDDSQVDEDNNTISAGKNTDIDTASHGLDTQEIMQEKVIASEISNTKQSSSIQQEDTEKEMDEVTSVDDESKQLTHNEKTHEEDSNTVATSLQPDSSQVREARESEKFFNLPVPPSSQWIILHPNEQVFFAGDSLMQGVAPHVQQWLRKQFSLNSINLSKQSTGLSYPSFFNWPKTIEDTLKTHPEIRLLVIFLGPNDPWDFPNPEHPSGPYLKFMSPEWERVYQTRINKILDVAQQKNVKVIWLGVPFVKRKRLQAQMNYLGQLIERTVAGKVLWLPTHQLLSGGKDTYEDSIEIQGQFKRVRSKDGTHFTLLGQKLLATYIESYLQFEPQHSRKYDDRDMNHDGHKDNIE